MSSVRVGCRLAENLRKALVCVCPQTCQTEQQRTRMMLNIRHLDVSQISSLPKTKPSMPNFQFDAKRIQKTAGDLYFGCVGSARGLK